MSQFEVFLYIDFSQWKWESGFYITVGFNLLYPVDIESYEAKLEVCRMTYGSFYDMQKGCSNPYKYYSLTCVSKCPFLKRDITKIVRTLLQ